MRIHRPITIVAVLVTLAIGIVAVIIGQVQTVATQAAPSWPHFVASNATRIVLPALVVGVIVWIIERNIRRHHPAA